MTPSPTSAPQQRPRQTGRWVRLWDRVSLYLPIVAMGGLAMISYWVLRSAPSPEAPTPARPVTHQPDYFMRGFAVRTFDTTGTLRSEIYGQEARHHPDTDTLEVDRARLRSYSDPTRLTTAQAQHLTVNAGQTHYQMRGKVHVVREAAPPASGADFPAMTFESEALLVRTDDQTISSDSPVTLLRGSDRITADQLHYSDAQRVALLQGRVNTTLAPRR